MGLDRRFAGCLMHTIPFGCGQAVLISAGWTDAQREDKRKELRFVLDATVCGQDGTVFYYQGLHDVASVLLLVMGDKAAYQTLTHLSLCQLRDCTRYKLSSFYLHLTQRILQHCRLLPCHLKGMETFLSVSCGVHGAKHCGQSGIRSVSHGIPLHSCMSLDALSGKTNNGSL